MINGIDWFDGNEWHNYKISVKLALKLQGRKMYRAIMGRGVRWRLPF